MGVVNPCIMTLSDYIYTHNLTPKELRLILGISKSAMSLYLRHKRIPRSDILERITQITDGAVTREDFLDKETPPDCAVLHIRPDGTKRWIFPWSSGKPEQKPLYSSYLSNPLLRAIQVLNGRALFRRSGTFLLDGRVSDPKRIVRAANKILVAQGKPIIRYPVVAPIHPGDSRIRSTDHE